VVQGKGRIGSNDSECIEDEEYPGNGLQRYRQAIQGTAHQDEGTSYFTSLFAKEERGQE
jgi:hypothetical protein